MPETTPSGPIATFLAELDQRLRALPAERRAAERAELAQHLELLASALQARGLSEDEAERAAVERFGRAERIAGGLRDAWSGPSKTWEYARFFVAYAAFIVVAYLALFASMGDPLPPHLPWVIAVNALALPSAFIYADVRRRRRAAAR
jgi:hypothetical protein